MPALTLVIALIAAIRNLDFQPSAEEIAVFVAQVSQTLLIQLQF
jgi:hypothetical protein